MNSSGTTQLEALLALMGLLFAFGIILTQLSIEKKSFDSLEDSLKAKMNAINCSTIIDSQYSNSAEEINEELYCVAKKKNSIISRSGSESKEIDVLGKVSNDFGLRVETTEHYLEETQ